MRILASAATALVLCSLTFASAQGLYRSIDEIGLSNEDYGMLTDAAKGLYEAEAPKVGDESIWANPETKSHGTVELVEFYGRCASVKHLFRIGPTKEVMSVESRRCKSAEGEWLISPKP